MAMKESFTQWCIDNEMQHLIDEYDNDKNDKPFDAYSHGSKTKVWWKCKEGHSWQAVIYSRKKNGCPYCGGQMTSDGMINLKTAYPDIAMEWDYDKNDKPPELYLPKSNKAVWWICDKGHSYKKAISERTTRGDGCPYCSGRKVLKGYNDLATVAPEVASEWDDDLNYPLTAYEVTRNSNKKVMWKCRLGHSWKAKVNDRTSGTNCPYCAGRSVLPGFNDLATVFPELAAQWNYEKNYPLTPQEITKASNKMIWWTCPDCGETWRASANDRIRGCNCPRCSPNGTSFPEQAIFYYLKKNFEVENRVKIDGKEIDIFIPKLNIGIEYNGLYYHKVLFDRSEYDREKKAFFESRGICIIQINESDCNSTTGDTIYCIPNNKGLEWAIAQLCMILNVSIDVDIARDNIQILQLIYKKRVENSIAETNPDLISEWNFDKNGSVSPFALSFGSSRKIWWRCKEGHEWQDSVTHRVHGRGCPYCSRRITIQGKNDLKTLFPIILSEWDYDKNTILLEEVSAHSAQKVWWICEKGHSWQASISHRTKGQGCPICKNRVLLVGYNDLQTRYPHLAAEFDCESNGCKPDQIMFGTNKSYKWICPKCGYKWTAAVTDRIRGRGCPECAKTERGINRSKNDAIRNGSFQDAYPELADQWDSEKNELQPSDYPPKSNKKVWWKCSRGHSWQASIYDRAAGNNCPYCSNQKILKGYNYLATIYPQIAAEWDYSKNEMLPSEVSGGSNKKAWWICPECNSSYYTRINHRTIDKSGCPDCKRKIAWEKRRKKSL